MCVAGTADRKSSQKMSDTLQRQWQLLAVLHGKRFGLPVRRLVKELGVSRNTLYRYFRTFKRAGVPIDSEKRNGEARYRLLGAAMPPLRPTALQVQGLRLARRLLAPLEGTKLIDQLDTFVSRNKPAPGETPSIQIPPAQFSSEPAIIRAIEGAMLHGVRVAFTYEPVDSQPGHREVDPLTLYVRDGQLYLYAFDVARQAQRTFKVARMSSVEALEEKAGPHPEYDGERTFARFAHVAKIWDGPLVDVAVRISPRCARFVTEWPLVPSQELEDLPDGGVVVRASVCGTVEAMRWVLRWGKDAQVIEPADLRASVVSELLGAIQAYTGLYRTGDTTE